MIIFMSRPVAFDREWIVRTHTNGFFDEVFFFAILMLWKRSL